MGEDSWASSTISGYQQAGAWPAEELAQARTSMQSEDSFDMDVVQQMQPQEFGQQPAQQRQQVSPQMISPPSGTQEESPPSNIYQPQVEQLMSLGFPEQDARRALIATGGDLEAAADRLLF
ncbi:unnamed protein product [Polarella glacialis]|uniref:UBA domain-containing protein n=1 Tax=Polarella glacialis TaxID=89957 RepID=A0A813H7V0_POLGL|nr:unnamed protein product [Polarella glacialis]